MPVKKKKDDQAIEIIAEWKASRPDLKEKAKRVRKQRNHQKGIYIKFPEDLLEKIQELAQQKHIGYQTYLKFIISEHIERLEKKSARRS